MRPAASAAAISAPESPGGGGAATHAQAAPHTWPVAQPAAAAPSQASAVSTMPLPQIGGGGSRRTPAPEEPPPSVAPPSTRPRPPKPAPACPAVPLCPPPP